MLGVSKWDTLYIVSLQASQKYYLLNIDKTPNFMFTMIWNIPLGVFFFNILDIYSETLIIFSFPDISMY